MAEDRPVWGYSIKVAKIQRSLKTRRSNILGRAISALDNQHYPDVVQRLSEEFGRIGYRLLLFGRRRCRPTAWQIGPRPGRCPPRRLVVAAAQPRARSEC